MREILFRGKQKRSGKWVEGFYYYHRAGYSEKDILYESAKITTGITVSSGAYGERTEAIEYEVLPETVGQYTGLTDTNGKKIFEGDIVRCTDTTYDYSFIAVVLFGNPNAEYNWGFQLKRISGASANTDILLWADMEETGACIEVIGNIHEKQLEIIQG